MKTVLPKEIIEYSVEKHRFTNLKKYSSIYWTLLSILFLIGISLPLVKIDLFHNSRGLIKTAPRHEAYKSNVHLSIDTTKLSSFRFKGIKGTPFMNRYPTLNPQTDLVVECLVLPASKAFIHKGDKVEFYLDDYPKQIWGKATGEVLSTHHELININGLKRQKVICSINEKQLFMNDQIKVNLQKGLELSAKFFIEKKSLFKLLF